MRSGRAERQAGRRRIAEEVESFIHGRWLGVVDGELLHRGI